MSLNLENLKKHIDDVLKRKEAMEKTPEWKEYKELSLEYNGFISYMKDRRINKLYSYISKLIEDRSSYDPKVYIVAEEEINKWLERLKKHREKLYSIGINKGVIVCESNVMDLLWSVFYKKGLISNYRDIFTDEAFTIDIFTMERYTGQGEYGYHIYKLTQVL